MAGDQVNALRLCGVTAAQDGVHVLNFGRLVDSVLRAFGLLNEGVSLHFKAAAAGSGVTLEFGPDPVAGGNYAGGGIRSSRIVDGERVSRAKANQLLDGLLDLLRRDIMDGVDDSFVLA